MKKIFGALLVSGLFLALCAPAAAAETKTPKPIVVKDKITIKATVEAIDKANRTVTLKGPKGNVMTLPVDESVARFDQIQVGDHVTTQYYEEVALELRKLGTPAAPDSLTGAAASASGKKPGGAVVAQTVTTVTIQAIDLVTPAVTVLTQDGSVLSFRVHDKKHLKDASVGDQVVITQTQALAVSVETAKD